MTLDLDPGMVSLFGSAARVAILATLANATTPLTGYRVARIAQVQPIKVYTELRKLAQAGVVREGVSEGGGIGWSLVDPELRRLLRRRVRISWSVDWFRDEEGRRRRTRATRERLSRASPVDVEQFGPPGWSPRQPEDYDRPAEKDKVLVELGMRPSKRRRSER